MLTYPKIETLFERDPVTLKVTGKLRRPEFDLVKSWLVTEKVDGTNVRVFVDTRWIESIPVTGFRGRTDKAQLPPFLTDELQRLFPDDRVAAAFEEGMQVVLFGEGYGARIQKAGGDYREGVSFRLFDVVVRAEQQDWWLTWKDVEDVARKLGIKTVPVLGTDMMLGWAGSLSTGESRVAIEDRQLSGVDVDVPTREGIVARTEPPLFDRRGHRLIWKLKTRDLVNTNGGTSGGC